MIDSSDIMHFMMLNTLGMSVLTDAFRSARHADMTNTGDYQTEQQQSYVFIQGTGLERLIETFHLSYDADLLRAMFNYQYFHKNGS